MIDKDDPPTLGRRATDVVGENVRQPEVAPPMNRGSQSHPQAGILASQVRHALRQIAGQRPARPEEERHHEEITGAGGAVGLSAVELGKLMGARVIAAASSEASA